MALLGFPGQTPPFVPGPMPGGTPPFIPGPGMPPQISATPSLGTGGPAWLQKLAGGFNKFLGGLAGPTSPLLSQDEQQAAAQRQRMAMAATLLQASGPVPRGTSSPLAALGAAMQAGRQAGDAFTADALRARLMQAELAQANAPENPFAKIDPSKFTPESLAEFERTRQFSALRPIEEPDSFSRKLETVQDQVGPLSREEVLSLAGGGVTVNVGDQQENKPIPPSELDNIRLPDGTGLPVGTTYGQAKELGAKVFTADELKRKSQIEGALHTLDQLERMAFDPKTGVFVDSGGSILTDNVIARMAHGIANGLGALAGTDASKRRSVFNRTSQGTIASLIRSMGESGALSDGDVQRALAILPKLGVTPDTEEEARLQFEELRTILTRGASQMEQEFDFDPQTMQLVPRQ